MLLILDKLICSFVLIIHQMQEESVIRSQKRKILYVLEKRDLLLAFDGHPISIRETFDFKIYTFGPLEEPGEN